MTLTMKQRGELIKLFYLNGENAAEAVRIYRRNHKLRRGPCSVRSVRDLVRKFEETGCTCDRPRSGRPSVPVEVVAEVHNTITAGPLHTARSVARSLDLPKTTVLRLLRSVLRMFPYRFQRVQMLQSGDEQLRVDFANFFLIRYDEDNRWPLRILWTDEAHFSLTGNVNTKNCVHWADKNPHDVAPVPLHDAKVTVWCGISSTFVLGPYFFEEVTTTGVKSCSVTSARYKSMLQNYVIPELQQRNVISDIVWMQDGAPPHIAQCVRPVLQQHFGDRVISRNFAVSWPPRSPDLTPMDFWFWGYLKSKVYTPGPRDVSELKDAIKREVMQIPPVILRSSLLSTISRMQCVVACEGGHVENL